MEQMTFLRQNDEIVVPVSLDYIPNWNAWHVLRELWQNAADADEEGYKVYLDGTTLVVEDNGPGLEVRHFLLGTGDKDETARGRWREGLPLAMLVLTRLGLTANVRSNGNVIWNERERLQGEEVYKICWKRSETHRQGCRIEVLSWGESYPLYEDRFITPHDKRVVFHVNDTGDILKMEEPGIFNHDIWVGPAVDEQDRPFVFGYNVLASTNRDREMVDIGEVKTRIGWLWSHVGDEELWVEYLTAMKDEKAEQMAGPGWNYIYHKDVVAQAIQRVYGKDTVAYTTDAWKREATYRGATVIELPRSWEKLFKTTVGTDQDFVYASQKKTIEKVRINQLSDKEKYILRGLQREAGKMYCGCKVIPVIFENHTIVGQAAGHTIYVARHVLDDAETAMAILVHELAHVLYNTKDATPEHQQAIERVGAKIALRSWRKRRL